MLLETAPGQEELKDLLAQLAREAEEQVPAEVQEAVTRHLGVYGFETDFRPCSNRLQFEPKDTADLLRMAAYEALLRGNLAVAAWLIYTAGALKPQDALVLSDVGFALNEQSKLEQAK